MYIGDNRNVYKIMKYTVIIFKLTPLFSLDLLAIDYVNQICYFLKLRFLGTTEYGRRVAYCDMQFCTKFHWNCFATRHFADFPTHHNQDN